MSRFRSNCNTMDVDPRRLIDVISVMPAMRPNWRSSGVATEVAIVSGLAPGSAAETWMVGNSTCGSADTGSNRKAIAPASAAPNVSSVVAIGLSMTRGQIHGEAPSSEPSATTTKRAVEPEVDDRRRVEGQELADQQTAHDGHARADGEAPRPRLGSRPKEARRAARPSSSS